MLRDISRQRVLFNTKVLSVGLRVLVNVIVSFENLLKVADCSLKIEPALALGRADLVSRHAGLDEPVGDGMDGRLARGKEIDNLFLGVVLCVILRVRVGTRL